jgi:hypothetical protein
MEKSRNGCFLPSGHGRIDGQFRMARPHPGWKAWLLAKILVDKMVPFWVN